ncbi:MAG: GAF domain-containing protein [Myxococcales bacterium]|nr:GAF domain-containing protein [Myxococcales bacterium]
MPSGDIRSLDELGAAFRDDPRLAAYTVAALEPGLIEVRVGEAALLFADARVFTAPERLTPLLARARDEGRLLLLGSDSEFDGAALLRDQAELWLVPLPISRVRLDVTLRNHGEAMLRRVEARVQGGLADRYGHELSELTAIARLLSSERDVVKLLGLILEKTRHVTGADAGSVYIVEGRIGDPEGGEARLRFMVSQNDSTAIDFREFTLPVDEKSIVGAAVIGRRPINIADLHALATDGKPRGFRHNRDLDEKTGYRARSMLTVPMSSPHGEVIGVIQLINRKLDPRTRLVAGEDFERLVVPFDRRSEELAETLAAQAGISLENARLYEDIRRLFEGFVNASVAAIESRDPTTSGHSQRVATLTCALASTVDRVDDGPYAALRFTVADLKQIEYAGLLHDFGKVGVREKVLVKAKKLYEHDRDLLLSRFDYIRKSIEAAHLRRKLERVITVGVDRAADEFARSEGELRDELAQVDDIVAFILRSNEPTVLDEGSFERLIDIAGHLYTDPYGERKPFLTAAEIEALKVPRGSLTLGERVEIERHVVHTYQFLATIPWGREMRNIPRIAGAHHEKLDGTGYPRGLKSAEIPVESKMMAIADIFDALTASDRPYKRAVPVDKALDILRAEVKHGKCDADLFGVFVEARVWTRVIPG